jgi:hypothetical protein
MYREAWVARVTAVKADGEGKSESDDNDHDNSASDDADAAPAPPRGRGRHRNRRPVGSGGPLTPGQRGVVPSYRVLEWTSSPGLLALIPARLLLLGAAGGALPCSTNAAWDRAYHSAAQIRRAVRRHRTAPVLLGAALVGPEDRGLWLADYAQAVFGARPIKTTNVVKVRVLVWVG